MDQLVVSLAEAAIISTLDANSRYWQDEIEDWDQDELATGSHHALYWFIRMPFRFQHAP